MEFVSSLIVQGSKPSLDPASKRNNPADRRLLRSSYGSPTGDDSAAIVFNLLRSNYWCFPPKHLGVLGAVDMY